MTHRLQSSQMKGFVMFFFSFNPTTPLPFGQLELKQNEQKAFIQVSLLLLLLLLSPSV